MKTAQDITKDYKNQNKLETIIKLTGELENKQLTITTSKYNKALRTSALVGTIDGDFISHLLFGDYSTVLISEPVAATTNNILKQHNSINIEQLISSIKDYYINKG